MLGILGVNVAIWLHVCFTAGNDYKHTRQVLTFNESITQQSVQVPISQDGFSEETEQFHANLTLMGNNGISVIVDPAMATVNITDGSGELQHFQLESE